MREDLSAKLAEFCSHLRAEHGFGAGTRETAEALRAIEIVGVGQRARVAAALRTIYCSRFDELEPFDRAFAAFFSTKPLGVQQPKRVDRRRVKIDRMNRQEPADAATTPVTAQPERLSLAGAWEVRRARYSPEAAEAQAITIPAEGLDAALAQADGLIERLRLVRSPRWKPRPRGSRLDLRRTLRASLRTGGDAIVPRMLGHPLRNPRFLLLLDGSRSMSEHGARMLQFARALCRRTRRAHVFLFSTGLRDVTRKLREAGRGGTYRLGELGESWGGGTRIGATLTECVRKYGARFGDQTFVVIVSDGLDVGEIPQLKWAMAQIARRSAGVAWINPEAGRPGYVPSARGMQAALPYVTMLASLDDIDRLAGLGARNRVAAGA